MAPPPAATLGEINGKKRDYDMNVTAATQNPFGFGPNLFPGFGGQTLGAPTAAPLGVPAVGTSNFGADSSALSAEAQETQAILDQQREQVHLLTEAFAAALLGDGGGAGASSGSSQGASINSPFSGTATGAANGNSAAPASFAPIGGGGSAAPTGASSAAGSSSGTGSGNASEAVEIAKKYMGQKSGHINGMDNFTHAGGMTNNCADFVSACLANAGVYKKKEGDASVATLKKHLQEDGWKPVAKAQSKPGDVAIFNGSQHIELVSEAGGKNHIGSNNGGKSEQTITEDSGNWGKVEYLTKG